jgi:hypothetical protein
MGGLRARVANDLTFALELAGDAERVLALQQYFKEDPYFLQPEGGDEGGDEEEDDDWLECPRCDYTWEKGDDDKPPIPWGNPWLLLS